MQKYSDRFFVLDFDRTLGNTTAIYRLYASVVAEYTMFSYSAMERARRSIEEAGGSFDILSYVKTKIDQQTLDIVATEYIERAKEMNLLHEGAEHLLWVLAHAKIPHAVMTYGSEEWQILKLKAAGIVGRVPYRVIPIKGKAKIIVSWVRDDGLYDVPSYFGGITAGAVILVDDKAIEFEGMHTAGVRGYWYKPSGEDQLLSQSGRVNKTVIPITHLSDVLLHEAL